MPFELTPEEEMVRKVVREFTEKEIIPHRRELRAENWDFVMQLAKKQAAAGFHLNLIPRQKGGTGLGQIARSITMEEICAGWPLIYPLLGTEFAWCFVNATGGEVEKKWMPGIAKGSVFASPMITESSGGSDVLGFTTAARKDGNSWVINGRKCFIHHAHISDFGMVLAKTGDPNDPATKGVKALSAFIVEKDMPGFRLVRGENTLSEKAQTSELVFDNVRVPENYLVGEVGRGIAPVFTAVGDIGRLGITAMLNGCILGSYQCSVKFAKERVLYGKPISTLQAIQWRIADILIDLETSRALAYRAGWLRNKGIRCDAEQAVAKYFATQAAHRCALHAINIHGAYGVLEEYMPQVYYRFAPPMIGAGGTDEILKQIMARAALEGADPVIGSKAAESGL